MDDRIALITGASRLDGIGRSICVALAADGFDIFFTTWLGYDSKMPWGANSEHPKQIQDEVVSHGVQCGFGEFDLSKPESVDAIFERVTTELGTPTVLINNATFSTQTDIDTIDVEALDQHYAVNVRAVTLLCSKFLKTLPVEVPGRIVNLSSGQSLGPMPNEVAYAITKASIEVLTSTLAPTLAQRSVTINAVNPGPTDTGWMTPAVETQLKQMSPSRRVGMPKDAARLIRFLVSEEAAWITGQVIHSEGGFLRG